jgi:hypothetical protein
MPVGFSPVGFSPVGFSPVGFSNVRIGSNPLGLRHRNRVQALYWADSTPVKVGCTARLRYEMPIDRRDY